jgi:hypothetical protein
LERGRPRFPRNSTCSAVLRCLPGGISISATGLSPAPAGRPRPFAYRDTCSLPDAAAARQAGPPTPRAHRAAAHSVPQVWARPRSLTTTDGVSLISFPPGTEMFQFPGLPPHRLCIQRWVIWHHPDGVAPFGDPRITACWRLPEAYRSHPRPSSALGAKASTVRPC